MSKVFAKIFNTFWQTVNQKCYMNKYQCTTKCVYIIRTRNYTNKRHFVKVSGNKFGFTNMCLPLIPCISLLSKDVISDTPTSDLEDNITHLIVLSKIALEKGDIEKAEALLELGLKICEDYKITFGLPFMYDILATIAFVQGDTEKAEQLLVTVIEKMLQNGISDNDDHIIDFKLRLARIYSSYKDNTLAEIGYKTCLEAQKMKIEKGDMSTKAGMLYVNILFWYGVHMIKNAKYQEAKQMIDIAYDYSSKIKGLSPYQEMVILYTLADLNIELGEYDIALSKMQTAVMLGKGISSSDLPKCYVKLAKIYMKLGVYDQAKLTAEKGMKLARMFGKIETESEAMIMLEQLKLLNK